MEELLVSLACQLIVSKTELKIVVQKTQNYTEPLQGLLLSDGLKDRPVSGGWWVCSCWRWCPPCALWGRRQMEPIHKKNAHGVKTEGREYSGSTGKLSRCRPCPLPQATKGGSSPPAPESAPRLHRWAFRRPKRAQQSKPEAPDVSRVCAGRSETHLWGDEAKHSQSLGLAVLLLGHAGRDLAQDLDALALFPTQDLHLAHPQGVLGTFQLHLDHVVVPSGELARHPAHVTGVEVDLSVKRGGDI